MQQEINEQQDNGILSKSYHFSRNFVSLVTELFPTSKFSQKEMQESPTNHFRQEYRFILIGVAPSANFQLTSNQFILMEQKESLLFEGYVSLCPKDSPRLVLDMPQGPQGQLILYDGHGGSNQQFRVAQCDFGQVTLRLRSSGKALAVQQQSEDDGARIIQEEFTDSPSQRFRMQEVSPHSGEYIIYTFCGKAFDVCEASLKKNAVVFQYAFNGGNNQLWKFPRVCQCSSCISHFRMILIEAQTSSDFFRAKEAPLYLSAHPSFRKGLLMAGQRSQETVPFTLMLKSHQTLRQHPELISWMQGTPLPTIFCNQSTDRIYVKPDGSTTSQSTTQS